MEKEVQSCYLARSIHVTTNASGGLQVAACCLVAGCLAKATHSSLSVLGEWLASSSVGLEDQRSVEVLLLWGGVSQVAANSALGRPQKAEKAWRVNLEHTLRQLTMRA